MSEPFYRHHVRIYRNLVYAPFDFEGFDPEKHLLDVYAPFPSASGSSHPVIFYLHGGAWMFGDRKDDKPRDIAKCLARCGYVVVVPSYRLSQVSKNDIGEVAALMIFISTMIMFSRRSIERQVWVLIAVILVLTFIHAELQLPPRRHCHPTQLVDCAMALSWTCKHIHRYSGDKKRTILMGHSAGGHLVTLLANQPKYLTDYHIHRSWIKGVVGISGVYSDERLCESALGVKVGQTIFGHDRSEWKHCFAMNYISNETPPTCLINAEIELGLKVHAYDYYWSLKRHGVYCEQHSFKGLNHFDVVAFWTRENRKVLYTVLKFLAKCLE